MKKLDAHHQVVVEELAGPLAIDADAADDGGEMNDERRLAVPIEPDDVGVLAQVVVGAGRRGDARAAQSVEPLDEMAAEKAGATGDQYALIGPEAHNDGVPRFYTSSEDMTAIDTIKERLRLAADIHQAMADSAAASIAEAAELIAVAFRRGGKLLLCGNGGSAADCQHVAAEFVGRFAPAITRPPLPAIALTTDTSFITAHANDVSFDDIFARQVMALGRRGDVLVAISTSGNSRNVIAAATEARHAGLSVIALVGEGGVLADAADVAIRVPSRDTALIQQVHLAIEHLICQLVEQASVTGSA